MGEEIRELLDQFVLFLGGNFWTIFASLFFWRRERSRCNFSWLVIELMDDDLHLKKITRREEILSGGATKVGAVTGESETERRNDMSKTLAFDGAKCCATNGLHLDGDGIWWRVNENVRENDVRERA